MDKIELFLEKIGFLEYTELQCVKKISSKTKIPSVVVVLVFLVLGVILLFIPYFTEVLTTLIMFGIPAFETFRALKSKSEKDDEELLTYWIVFSTLYTFDNVFRWLLNLWGFYSIFRLVVLMVLFYSKRFGSRFIYARAIRPFFERFGEKFDELMKPLEEQGRRISRYIQVQKDEYKNLKKMRESMGAEKEKTD